MKNLSSISFFAMAGILIPIGIYTTNLFVQIAALILSIIFSILAIIKSFKEKRNN